MQDLSDNRKHALGEVLFDELRAICEILEDVPKRTKFNKLVDKDQPKALNNHEKRITALEAA
jgi:hypothetical protein